MARKAVLIAAFVAAFLMPAAADEFAITAPDSLAKLTMPCWNDKQVSEALTVAKFDAVTHGLVIEKTDPSQPLVTFWLHTMTGRGAVTLSQTSGEECIIAIVVDGQ